MLLPGRTSKFDIAYGVENPRDVVMEVSLDFMDNGVSHCGSRAWLDMGILAWIDVADPAIEQERSRRQCQNLVEAHVTPGGDARFRTLRFVEQSVLGDASGLRGVG